MANEIIQYSVEDGVAVLRFDDGKANVFSHAALAQLNDALDRAQRDSATSLVIAGRPGRFSAGFDLSIMQQGPEQAAQLVVSGARFAIRVFEWPAPVVLAVTGHALAMGAVLLLAADERIGSEGSFKVGLNEVAIGMTPPKFVLDLACERLAKRHLYRACSGAEIYSPTTAVEAGFFDSLADPQSVVETAITRARLLGTTLDPRAHRETKTALRATTVAKLWAGLPA